MITSSVVSKVAKLALAVGGIGSVGSAGSLVTSLATGGEAEGSWIVLISEIEKHRGRVGNQKSKIQWEWTIGRNQSKNWCEVSRVEWDFVSKGEDSSAGSDFDRVVRTSGPRLGGEEGRMNRKRFDLLNKAINYRGEKKGNRFKRSDCSYKGKVEILLDTWVGVILSREDDAKLKEKIGRGCGSDGWCNIFADNLDNFRKSIGMFLYGVDKNGDSCEGRNHECVHLYLTKKK